jgi:hypothetical protein
MRNSIVENKMILTILRVLKNIFEWIITGLGKASFHEFIVAEGEVIKSVEILTARQGTIIHFNYLPKEIHVPFRVLVHG